MSPVEPNKKTTKQNKKHTVQTVAQAVTNSGVHLSRVNAVKNAAIWLSGTIPAFLPSHVVRAKMKIAQ